jgi:hypothetical protein
MAFAERVQDFFAAEDFAVAATWTPSAGGAQQSAAVIFDTPDELLLANAGQYTGVMSTEYAMLLNATDFPLLKTGETVNVAGANYKVREARLLDDGKVKLVSLSKV